MFLSAFELFKIGIGPSSSHTMGPMIAAARFLDSLRDHFCGAPLPNTICIRVHLHGSLAMTGRGHATDRAVALGLLGFRPNDVDPKLADEALSTLHEHGNVCLAGLPPFVFVPNRDLVFDFGAPLTGHPNGVTFQAFDLDGPEIHSKTYFSIGGGFVVSQDELEKGRTDTRDAAVNQTCPYPFSSAREMLRMGCGSGLSIAQMKRTNEEAFSSRPIDPALDDIWLAMKRSIVRGLNSDGVLPGGLGVRRRARNLHQALLKEEPVAPLKAHNASDWLVAYAMAVNEENAAGGQIVTAPTNGASGVIPAVLHHYMDHRGVGTGKEIRDFLLVAAAIGGIIKHNASISGAELGCQGEIGSASAMAAAGYCAVLGGTNAQIENAAEIALEHHLGLTCDPIKGLVQAPCIERNAIGAVKAVSAARLALRGDGSHLVPLDVCIETMRQTGRDMSAKYKETSNGGLAVNLPEC